LAKILTIQPFPNFDIYNLFCTVTDPTLHCPDLTDSVLATQNAIGLRLRSIQSRTVTYIVFIQSYT